jgi:hypothetical protein
MKQLLISISYNYFILPKEADISEAIKIIGHLMPVERTTLEGETVYSPEKNIDVSFDLIDSKLVRIPTKEEKENKKIKDLEQRIGWKEDEIKKKNDRIKELECFLEQSNKPEENEKL